MILLGKNRSRFFFFSPYGSCYPSSLFIALFTTYFPSYLKASLLFLLRRESQYHSGESKSSVNDRPLVRAPGCLSTK